MKRIFLYVFVIFSLKMTAQDGISHQNWQDLLSANVSAKGVVNYKGFKAQKSELKAYCDLLSSTKPSENWSKNDKLTFWMNAYNAFTVQLVVEKYPISMITSLDGGKTWDVKRITIGGKKYSLNDIENNILRKLGDARIHFGINCAAKSCPPLSNIAFSPENVETELNRLTKSFVNNASANKITSKSVKISKIFDWYKADFPNLIGFLNKYSTTKIDAKAKIEFQEYDWALNQ